MCAWLPQTFNRCRSDASPTLKYQVPHEAFANHCYTRPFGEGDSLDNLTLIASNRQGNKKVLREMEKLVNT